MKYRETVALVICMLLIWSFAPSSTGGSESKIAEITIEHPERADPEDDCRRAVNGGDVRFVGIMSFAMSVPGVENYDELYSHTNGVKVIKGTTDTPADAEQENFQYLA